MNFLRLTNRKSVFKVTENCCKLTTVTNFNSFFLFLWVYILFEFSTLLTDYTESARKTPAARTMRTPALVADSVARVSKFF